MDLIDLTKDRQTLLKLYQPKGDEFSQVLVPELPFAMIDGEGSPDGGRGAKAIKDLYRLIYPFRREARERLGKSFVEPPAEMLYWADDMQDIACGNKANWKWRAMITLPVWIDEKAFNKAVELLRSQTEDVASSLRMETFEEGPCVQIMHVGKPEEVPEKLYRLYKHYLPENDLTAEGAYHEIYLDDWSRVAPDRRKVILRQPVRAMR